MFFKSLGKQSVQGHDDILITGILCIQDVVTLILVKLLNDMLEVGM